jgi:hypothetical protein
MIDCDSNRVCWCVPAWMIQREGATTAATLLRRMSPKKESIEKPSILIIEKSSSLHNSFETTTNSEPPSRGATTKDQNPDIIPSTNSKNILIDMISKPPPPSDGDNDNSSIDSSVSSSHPSKIVASTASAQTITSISTTIPTRFASLGIVLATNEYMENEHSLERDYQVQPQDVICGQRGLKDTSHKHTGNERFRVIIEIKLPTYRKATTRVEKTNLIRQIVEMVRQSGGKFLRQELQGGLWYDIGNIRAREKAGHALRGAMTKSQMSVKTSKSRTRISKEEHKSSSHVDNNDKHNVDDDGDVEFNDDSVHYHTSSPARNQQKNHRPSPQTSSPTPPISPTIVASPTSSNPRIHRYQGGTYQLMDDTCDTPSPPPSSSSVSRPSIYPLQGVNEVEQLRTAQVHQQQLQNILEQQIRKQQALELQLRHQQPKMQGNAQRHGHGKEVEILPSVARHPEYMVQSNLQQTTTRPVSRYSHNIQSHHPHNIQHSSYQVTLPSSYNGSTLPFSSTQYTHRPSLNPIVFDDNDMFRVSSETQRFNPIDGMASTSNSVCSNNTIFVPGALDFLESAIFSQQQHEQQRRRRSSMTEHSDISSINFWQDPFSWDSNIFKTSSDDSPQIHPTRLVPSHSFPSHSSLQAIPESIPGRQFNKASSPHVSNSTIRNEAGKDPPNRSPPRDDGGDIDPYSR